MRATLPVVAVQAETRDPPRAPSARLQPELLEAARQFEGLLLRQMLKSLERTASIDPGGARTNSAYRSLVVDALADGISRAGGAGFAEVVARSLALAAPTIDGDD
jgi:Rod binding domain-containing protein